MNIDDIEGFDEAEKEQDATETGGRDFGPRLLGKDKERMAENNIRIRIEEILKQTQKDENGNPVSNDENDFFWAITATCDHDLRLPPVPMQKKGKFGEGRDTPLDIAAGESFSFTLSNIPKRFPVMWKLFEINRLTGDTSEPVPIDNCCITILEFLQNGTPILSIGRWREGTPTPRHHEQAALAQG